MQDHYLNFDSHTRDIRKSAVEKIDRYCSRNYYNNFARNKLLESGTTNQLIETIIDHFMEDKEIIDICEDILKGAFQLNLKSNKRQIKFSDSDVSEDEFTFGAYNTRYKGR